MRRKIMKFTTVSVRIVILTIVLVSASFGWTLWAAGSASNLTVGQMLLLENNRIWPTGIPYCNGSPDPNWVPHEWRAEYFRQALHRLIDKTELEALYPDKQKAEHWLPPWGSSNLWNKPNLELPTCDRTLAVDLLNDAGFVEGSIPNPYYDPDYPWSAEHMRIDPLGCMDEIEYYTIGPIEDPVGFELATMITQWWRQAGIPILLIHGTWLGMQIRLRNVILEDYQIMTGFSYSWKLTTPPTPEILYNFTYSENLPLWNFACMNYSEPCDGVSCTPPPVDPYEYSINRDADHWGEKILLGGTQNELREAAHEIQEVLGTHEPYLPLLEWKQNP